jgi:hypothetical protein
MGKIKFKEYISNVESNERESFTDLYKNNNIPENEILSNLGLFINRQEMSRILFMNEIYQKIMGIHGVIMEFGVRWGQNLALFETFRGIYEPYNYNRKIIGFDTFEGFPSVHKKDGNSDIIQKGAYSVTKNYEDYLSKILNYHENNSPISHIKKYEIVKGNATETIINYLNKHPETIISFAYFDFDIYEPTKICLEAIKEHITKGTIIGFDELNMIDYPGETLALKEVFGLNKYKINHSKYGTAQSYIVID